MAAAIKKQVLNEIRSFGLAGAVDDEALDCITSFLQQQASSDQLHALLQRCQQDRPASGDISKSVVESAIAQIMGKGQGFELVTIINAFDIPKISYDAVGRKMFADTVPRSLFADATAKQKLYLDRLQLISQRMRRNKVFESTHQVLAGLAADQPRPQLTDLQSLRGLVGQVQFVMGCVSRSEAGGSRLVLEDATGSVPLDISNAQWPSGFFTENCVVLAQGVLAHDNVFYAQQLGLPPVERREELAVASQRLNFFGGPSLGPEELHILAAEEASGGHREDRIIVCANVWLDQQSTLDKISTLLAGFQEVAIVPPLFVLMGNFHSKAPAVAGCMSAAQRAGGGGAAQAVDFMELKAGFAALAKLIDRFPRIKEMSRFVFVPGPGDPSPSDVLPQPPLPAFFTEDVLRVVPNAVFTSNPCRIRYLSKEVVLFRYDILKRLRRRCLLPISGGEPGSAEAMWQHLAVTLLQQSHLCPLPLLHQPAYWQWDHALSLYPLPHAVIVADMSPQATYTHEGSTVFTTGSFAEGFFAAYLPCQQQVELSALPRDGQQYTELEEDDLGHDSQRSDQDHEDVVMLDHPAEHDKRTPPAPDERDGVQAHAEDQGDHHQHEGHMDVDQDLDAHVEDLASPQAPGQEMAEEEDAIEDADDDEEGQQEAQDVHQEDAEGDQDGFVVDDDEDSIEIDADDDDQGGVDNDTVARDVSGTSPSGQQPGEVQDGQHESGNNMFTTVLGRRRRRSSDHDDIPEDVDHDDLDGHPSAVHGDELAQGPGNADEEPEAQGLGAMSCPASHDSDDDGDEHDEGGGEDDVDEAVARVDEDDVLRLDEMIRTTQLIEEAQQEQQEEQQENDGADD